MTKNEQNLQGRLFRRKYANGVSLPLTILITVLVMLVICCSFQAVYAESPKDARRKLLAMVSGDISRSLAVEKSADASISMDAAILVSDGYPSSSVYGMGASTNGQLGVGIANDTNVPILLSPNAFGGPIAGGIEHTLVTDSEGTLWITGLDWNGQYGDGPTNSSSATISMQSTLTGKIKSVAAGNYHTLVLVEENGITTALGAGEGSSGQLGDGRGVDTNLFMPVKVSDPVKKVASFQNNSYVLTDGGELYVFGANLSGGLGVGTIGIQVDTPTKVASNVVDMAAGSGFTLALLKNGNVMAAGLNTYGQFGDGTTDSSLTFKLTIEDKDVKAIAAGSSFSMFLRSDGSLQTVGYNSYGQIGAGDTAVHGTFYTHETESVAKISAGRNHGLFITDSGVLMGMGSSTYGQLGLGDFGIRLTPDTIQSSGVVDVVGASNSTFFMQNSLTSLKITGLTQIYEGGTVNYDCYATWADGKTTLITAQAVWSEDSADAEFEQNSGILTVAGNSAPASFTITAKYFGMSVTKDIFVIKPPKGSALWGHGYNAYSQLGLDTTVSMYSPQNITPDKIISAAGGAHHSLYVLENGDVFSMGNNNYGQLGTGDTIPRTAPAKISALDGLPAVKVGAGSNHSMVVLRDGSLWSMGLNSEGQLGVGDAYKKSPTKIANSSILQADGGAGHSVFLTSDGAVWTMGRDVEGQMGNGIAAGTPVPFLAHPLGATFVAAGENHTLFRTNDAALWGMGDNSRGQLGLVSSIIHQSSPITLVMSNVKHVSAGALHSLYTSTDKKLYVTGSNDYGQLGNNMPGTDAYGFMQLSSFTGVTRAWAGGNFSIFQDNDALYGMGDNSYGQHGSGTSTPSFVPVALPHTNVGDFALGDRHVLFAQRAPTLLKIRGLLNPYEGKTANYLSILNYDDGYQVDVTDSATWDEDQSFTSISSSGILTTDLGTAGQSVNVSAVYTSFNDSIPVQIISYNLPGYNLKGAGSNTSYQLGDSTDTSPHSSPYNVASNVASMASGDAHSLYLKSDGSLWSMGDNWSGQLGVGDTATRSSPVQVDTNVVNIAAGSSFSLYSKTDGSLWAMGNNTTGQLGVGDNNSRMSPEMVQRAAVTGVEAGDSHSLFSLANGELWGMGDNSFGQLGLMPSPYGSLSQSHTPLQLSETNVSSFAAGGNNSLFVSGGALYGMGGNGDGQLGLGYTSSKKDFPVSIIPSNVATVAAGENHSLFRTDTGVLYGMGLNSSGQLGQGAVSISEATPLQIDTNVVDLGSGANHSLWTQADGSLWGVGANGYGQLAQGVLSSFEPTPLLISPPNVPGMAGGGNQTFFLDSGPVPPTVATTGVTTTTATSAVSGGNVDYDGGATVTARGVCWSDTTNPTTSDTCTSNGTGSGAFTSNITGLTSNKTYHVRAFATNSLGTGYGSDRTFTANSPTVSFTSAGQSRYENTASMTITAQLSVASDTDINIPFTVGGTATGSGTDYTISSSPITIAAGSTSQSISITINNDSLIESNETIIVTMGSPTNATTAAITVHTATISDNDSEPSVSFTSANQAGAEAAGSLTVTAQLSAPFDLAVTVPFSVSGSATGGGTDYSITSSPVIITAGALTQTIVATINDDILEEENETVIVTMGTPTNATQGATTVHTATISNDDLPPTITTNTVTSISANHATGGGNITSGGSEPVTARGVCWGLAPAPTVSDAHSVNGSGGGSFLSKISGLTPETPYFVRAWATNIIGTSYGDTEQFTTTKKFPWLLLLPWGQFQEAAGANVKDN